MPRLLPHRHPALARLGAPALGAFAQVATFIANRCRALPPGQERFMTADAFHEHPGLAGAFLPVVPWYHGHGR
ncbi:hypothetical protein [Teichococcus aestuarii]|uniref:hypothetical protein n=1 Tax=Teichococcus aestuarii TaxID=568898 RepID=UPI0015E7ECD5|nr:hypothetical protein [Pseudoroseomonas aestuarii]